MRQNEHDLRPGGRKIGWIDGDEIYLDPDVSYEVAKQLVTRRGDQFSISAQMLRKQLKARRLLASREEARDVLTIRRTVEGVNRSVLHFLASTLVS